jgi:hypothetical protein
MAFIRYSGEVPRSPNTIPRVIISPVKETGRLTWFFNVPGASFRNAKISHVTYRVYKEKMDMYKDFIKVAGPRLYWIEIIKNNSLKR